MWLLPGLAERRVGLYLRMHHAIADGVAGVAAIGALLDLAADATVPAAPPWTPAPMPSAGELLRENMRWRARGLHGSVSRLARPVSTLRQARSAWPAWRELFAEERAPRTSLNRPIGGHRSLALIRSRLDLAKQIAHAHDVKVNDVVLAAVAGDLRELLDSRGEPVDELVLRVMGPDIPPPGATGSSTGQPGRNDRRAAASHTRTILPEPGSQTLSSAAIRADLPMSATCHA